MTDLGCPVCDGPMRLAGEASYYIKAGCITTPMSYCRECDVYVRDVDQSRLVGHHEAASYVNLRNEQTFLRQREQFFGTIISIVERYWPRPAGRVPVLVDFGCSYGHMLEIANKSGYNTTGVELNCELLRVCAERGLKVVPTLDEVAAPVDVFSLIDSLYYVPNPKEILRNIRGKIAPDGLLVLRVTNRNLLAWFRNTVRQDDDYTILGDLTVSYSHKSIRRLLSATGFEMVKLMPDSAEGKRIPWKTWTLYKLSQLIYSLTVGVVDLSPGAIAVARPATMHSGN